MQIGGKPQRGVDELVEPVGAGVGVGEECAGVGLFAIDTVLFGSESGGGEGVGVVGAHEPVPFAFELLEASPDRGLTGISVVTLLRDGLLEFTAQRFSKTGREVQVAVPG